MVCVLITQFAPDGCEVCFYGLLNLVTKFFIGNLKHPAHHIVIKINNQITHENNAIGNFCGTGAGNLARLNNHIIDRFVFSSDADPAINIDNGLEKLFIK